MKKFAVSLFCFAYLSAAVVAQEAPKAKTTSHAKSYHGVSVPDPYHWFESSRDPAVKAWIDGQNRYAEAELAKFAGREGLVKRITELALTAPSRTSPRIAGETLFFMKDAPPASQPVLVSQPWPQGSERVLVDTNRDKEASAVSDFWPSPSGKYVAYATSVGGSELSTIFFVETATGKRLGDVLPQAAGGTTPAAIVWDSDEKGLTYVRLPKGSLFDASLYHHTLGQPVKADRAVFGQGVSRIAEWELSSSDSGSQAAAMLHYGDGAPYRVVWRSADTWKVVADESWDIRSGGHWAGEELIVARFQNAPRGEVVLLNASGEARVVVPQGQWSVKEAYPIKDGVLVARVWGAEQRLEHWDLQGRLVRVVNLPSTEIGLGTVASSGVSSRALVTYRGWTVPERWVSYDGASGAVSTIFELDPVGDYSDIVVHRTEAVSRDGTRVPLTVMHHKSVTPDGVRPTILYGYGGFNVPQQANFLGSTLAWLERGGVYAVANLRGGGEFGEPWHQAGMKTRKQNVFDDFYACAQALHQSGWTNPEKLGIMGGSNGGLLVAASTVQHPEAFRAVVGLVGVYDSLGHETFPNGTYNVPEFGDTGVAEEFRAINAYSPYQNVKKGTAYPAMLLQTGENDLRVAPWQTWKFGAAMQAATTSGQPILVVTQTNAGHGKGASFSQRVGKTALGLTFMAQHLGLADQPVQTVKK